MLFSDVCVVFNVFLCVVSIFMSLFFALFGDICVFFFANFSSLLMSVFIFFLSLNVVFWRFSFLHFRIINWVFPRFDGGLFFFNISVLNRCLSYCLLSFACFFQYFRIINWSSFGLSACFTVVCLFYAAVCAFFVRFVSCLFFFRIVCWGSRVLTLFLLFFPVCLKQN